MALNRSKQRKVIEALIAPKSIFDIMLALNTPDDRSPYKKNLENKIFENVSMEEIMDFVDLLLEISHDMTEKMRETIVRERLNEKSYEQLQSRQAFQFNQNAAQSEARIKATRLSVENRIAYLTEMLAIELPKKKEYEKNREELNKEIKKVETKWEKRHAESAEKFYDSFETKVNNGALGKEIKLTPEHKERINTAYKTATPEKLTKLNEAAIKEAIVKDPVTNEEKLDDKKLDDVAKSMAAKDDFVRNLQVLTEAGRIKHENSSKKDEEYFPKPTEIKELNKQFPIESSQDKDKKAIKKTIKCNHELKQTEKKLVMIDTMEEKLEAAKKEQKTISPDSPG